MYIAYKIIAFKVYFVSIYSFFQGYSVNVFKVIFFVEYGKNIYSLSYSSVLTFTSQVSVVRRSHLTAYNRGIENRSDVLIPSLSRKNSNIILQLFLELPP